MRDVRRRQTALYESAAQPLANWRRDGRTTQLTPLKFQPAFLDVPRRFDPTITRPGPVLECVGGELVQNEGKWCGRFRRQYHIRTRTKEAIGMWRHRGHERLYQRVDVRTRA